MLWKSASAQATSLQARVMSARAATASCHAKCARCFALSVWLLLRAVSVLCFDVVTVKTPHCFHRFFRVKPRSKNSEGPSAFAQRAGFSLFGVVAVRARMHHRWQRTRTHRSLV